MFRTGPLAAVREQISWAAQGIVVENFNRFSGIQTLAATAQQLRGALIGLQAGTVITGIIDYIDVAPATPANLSLAIFGIYDKTGVLKAQTANANVAHQSTGYKPTPLTAPWVAPATDGYYVVALMDQSGAGGMPSVMGNNAPIAGNNGDVARPGFAILIVRQNGVAALPTPAVFAAGGSSAWLALY